MVLLFIWCFTNIYGLIVSIWCLIDDQDTMLIQILKSNISLYLKIFFIIFQITLAPLSLLVELFNLRRKKK